MKALRLSIASVAAISATAGWAGPIGTSITISDGNYSGTGWYGNHEDNETETNPQTVKSQEWDLEGMYLNGWNLTLVGGFDFRNGQKDTLTPNGHTYTTGDIFIDVTGDVKYGYPANSGSTGGTTTNSFGYDYVIHFNSNVTSYSVFQITNQATVARVSDVSSSNPWKYVSGGTPVSSFQDHPINGYGLLPSSTYSNLTTFGSTSTGLQGYSNMQGQPDNNHYYLSVNTSFLPTYTPTTFHYTYQCGNDNLMGAARTPRLVPDVTQTAVLLGAVLCLLFGFRRRFVA